MLCQSVPNSKSLVRTSQIEIWCSGTNKCLQRYGIYHLPSSPTVTQEYIESAGIEDYIHSSCRQLCPQICAGMRRWVALFEHIQRNINTLYLMISNSSRTCRRNHTWHVIKVFDIRLSVLSTHARDTVLFAYFFLRWLPARAKQTPTCALLTYCGSS